MDRARRSTGRSISHHRSSGNLIYIINAATCSALMDRGTRNRKRHPQATEGHLPGRGLERDQRMLYRGGGWLFARDTSVLLLKLWKGCVDGTKFQSSRGTSAKGFFGKYPEL